MSPPHAGDAGARQVRGRTRAGRLRALDAWLLAREVALLGEGRLMVDIGFGELPITTLESARALQAVAPGMAFVGMESNPERVQAARRWLASEPQVPVSLRLCDCAGFDLEPCLGGMADVMRAMNVLRLYDPRQIPGAHATWAKSLRPGGLLMEGTSNPGGELLTALLVRRVGEGPGGFVQREGLLFYLGPEARAFAPRMFRDWLPMLYRRAWDRAPQLHAWFARWEAAWEQARPTAPAPGKAFAGAAALLACSPEVEALSFIDGGQILVWRPPGGLENPWDGA